MRDDWSTASTPIPAPKAAFEAHCESGAHQVEYLDMMTDRNIQQCRDLVTEIRFAGDAEERRILLARLDAKLAGAQNQRRSGGTVHDKLDAILEKLAEER